MNNASTYFSRLLIAVWLTAISSVASSQPRSESSAEAIAQSFFGQELMTRNGHTAHLTRSATTDNAGFFVFNDEANARFVIVSGDERQDQILGYSENGLFKADEIPCGLQVLLEQYHQEYQQLQVQGNSIDLSEVSKTRATSAVSPLIKTQWGQGNYYNNECPMDPKTNKRCLTGCVATAMAQIMNYHRYPSKGQGSNSYTSKKNSINQSMDFSAVSFNWSKMQNSYDASSSNASVNAVSTLMHACGVSVYMDYASSSSSANYTNATYAMIHNFKYNPNARIYRRNYHISEEWDQIIQEELKAGRPILYRGESDPDSEGNVSGHAFVLDGCDASGRYHFNFGWYGSANGYFLLSSIRPKSNDKTHNYTNDQEMVCLLSPKEVGNHEDPWYADKFEFNANNLSITFTNFWCHSSDANYYYGGYNGFWGWELKNVSTGKSVYGLYEVTNQKSRYGYKNISKSIDSKNFEEGATYLLYPVATDHNKKRKTYIRTLGSMTDYYLLKVKGGKIEVTLKGDPNGDTSTPKVEFVSVTCHNNNLDQLKPSDVLTLRATFKNTGKTSKVNTRLRIWDADMKGVAASETLSKSFPKNAETEVAFEYSLKNLTEGKYIATIQYQESWGDNNWKYRKDMLTNFTVKKESTASSPIIQFVSANCENKNLEGMSSKDKLVMSTTFKNTGKTADIKTRLKIWNEDMEQVAVSETVTKRFTSNAQTTVKFEYPLTGIPQGKYIVGIQYLKSWDDNKWYYHSNYLTIFFITKSDATAILGVPEDEAKEQPIYDLNGRRLTQPRKGINIIGGKKVLVK